MVERAALFSDGEMIGMDAFSTGQTPPRPEEGGERQITPALEAMTLKEAERFLILNALEKTNWVQKDAADLLGISKRVMNYKIKRHRIQNQRWRKGK